MVFGTIFAAGMLAILHWQASRDGGLFCWTLAGIDTLLVLMAVHGGAYWSLFPRGHGYWTANRLSALVLLLAAIYLPILARAVQERLSAPK